MPLMPDAGACLRRLVHDRAGLDLQHVDEGDLLRAADRLIAETGAHDAEELCDLMIEQPVLFDDLVADLTVGETYFLRDPAQLAVLEHDILPALVDHRAGTRRLRLWSAGCSTGEEAYTLAIITERVIHDLERWNVSILGTDLDRRSLAVAERGEYGPWSLRGMPDDVVDRFFLRHGETVEIAPRLRRMTRFAYLNLADDLYPSPITGTAGVDIVMCRNTLMYFHDRAAREVAGRLRTALADDGWLLLGAGEWRHGDRAGLTPHRLAAAVAFTGCPPEPAKPASPGRKTGLRPAAPGLAQRPVPGSERPVPASLPSPAPSNRRLYERARAHARRLELDDAEGLLRQVLACDPLSAEAHWLLGVVLRERGRTEAALEELRRCVFAEPEFDLGRFTLAWLLTRLGHADRAHREFAALARRLRSRAPDDPVAEGEGLTTGWLLHLTTTAGAVETAMPAGTVKGAL